MSEYKIGMDKLDKYKTGRYKYLIILERIVNIEICFWKYIINIMEI